MTVAIKEKEHRDDSLKLKIVIVGAGLGGLGCAISCLLAGHTVHVLESASQIGEVGAGIQVLPNSSRVLIHWGLEDALKPHVTQPRNLYFSGWKGNQFTGMDFHRVVEEKYPGTWFGDFHRADLHRCLYERVLELGGAVRCHSRVVDVRVNVEDGDGVSATAVLANGKGEKGDLIVGADGVFSQLRDKMLGRHDPAIKTGDLAYRVLLNGSDMLKDPDLEHLVRDPQVNYWLAPGAHAVNYVLRKGELFNMVLLVPDDIPDGERSTVEGDVEEMCEHVKGWDIRVQKALRLCKSVHKWKLCIRLGMDQWNHPSGTWTMLGDAVHATLPYLASGAGMSFEDGAVLGECLSRLPRTNIFETTNPKSTPSFITQKRHALAVYQACREKRTQMVVDKGNRQQYLYHLPDGPEQEERDRQMQMVPTPPGEALAWRDPALAPILLGYDHVKDVDANWRSSSALETPQKPTVEFNQDIQSRL